MDFVTDTLFAPLGSGDVRATGRALFLGARPHPFLNAIDADLWQPWKPYAASLPALPITDIPNGPYDLALLLIPKQVEEAKCWLALALDRLAPGGIVMAAAANDANGARLDKWLAMAGLRPQAYSKNKARCVWGRRPATLTPLVDDWRAGGAIRAVDFGDGMQLKSCPGLFSWDRADPGSRLFADHIPAGLSGMVADFGSGIGYLSHALLRRSAALSDLYLVEADARALALSLQNLENVCGSVRIHPRWADSTRPVPDLPALDHIFMNPPFHDGKKTDPAIGQNFIRTAARHLKPGGMLHLVANAHLPYEETLQEFYGNVRIIVQTGGYKVLVVSG